MPDPTAFIIEQCGPYVDNAGRTVIEHRCIHGDAPENFTRFIGQVILEVSNTQTGQTTQIPKQFRIEADSPVEAFEKFDEAFEAFKKQATTPKIQIPKHDISPVLLKRMNQTGNNGRKRS